MENNEKDIHVRVLCKKLILITNKEEEESIQWLIGSPFFPQFTILSTFKCLHFQSSNNPNYSKESNNVQSLLLQGFNVIGALLVGNQNNNWEENARRAVESARKLRKLLRRDDDDHVIGASADVTSGEIRYFDSTRMDPISSVVYEDSSPENYIWERGCLLRCGLDVKIPICFPVHNPADSERVFSSGVDDTIVKLRDPNVVFMIEGAQETNGTVIVRGAKLNFQKDVSSYAILCENTSEDRGNSLFCSAFCSKNKPSRESADPIQVSIFFNKSGNPPNCSAPTAEYIPASEPAKHVVSSFKIEVLCYAAKDLPVAYAVSRLIVPGIVDQLISIKKDIMANLLTQHPKPSPFHFFPPGIMHPVTTIYELSYGETEMKQVEVRRSLHLRLGLPLDRPLLLVVNALNFSTHKGVSGNSLMRNASNLLKDVHGEVPSSGVSGGLVSRVDGSYEYYHYLQDGFDDSGWGCAYRSLQTLISWFRLQHYSSVEVPSHRKIQETLVEIGDKDPSFIGSRDWIGAIELSFVLDKLLGVSCKIMNVRSGADLPEKCRELALHFETQGTPVMIGGGVLAYTLLGVDYNEASGDCAFLILDPHYTGNDELKKIITGGWCGWKKAVDSKGRNFFLHDKFYNLLLPQRPNMV